MPPYVSAWLPISFQQKSYGKSMELRMGAVKAKVKRRVRGKRIPDPQKNIPRKIKRSLKTIESTEFEQLMHDPRLDGFLKNTTIGIKTTLFKRLEQKARKFNITIPAGFGKRPPLIKIPFWKSVEANGNYTLFLQAINKANLVELVEQRNITVLLPSDETIQQHLTTTLQQTPEEFFANTDKVASFVKHHILHGYITRQKFKNFLDTPLVSYLEGQTVKLKKLSDSADSGDDKDKKNKSKKKPQPLYSIQNAQIKKSDWKVENGLIHVIDKAFIPK